MTPNSHKNPRPIELGHRDILPFVDEVREQGLHRDLVSQPPPDDEELEVACAKAIASLWLPAALKEAERWLRLMPHLNTLLLLVCSNYIEPEDHPFAPFNPEREPVLALPDDGVKALTTPPGPTPSPYYPPPTQDQLSSYLDAQVEAFCELGKVAAGYGVRIGYEALAWGRIVDNWEQVWDVVRRVDRDNVGVILDSFNCLANQYADPTVSPTFLRNPASCSQTPIPHPPINTTLTARQPQNSTHAALLQNLSLLGQTIHAHKFFLFQVVDAELPCPPPGTTTSSPRAPARMTWSRASRLFPFEEACGAWLPVTDFGLAVVETGYNAWWSLEVFNKSLMNERAECVEEHGVQGMQSLRTLWDSVIAEVEEPVGLLTSSGESESASNSSRAFRHRL